MAKRTPRAKARALDVPTGAMLVLLAGIAGLLLIVGLVLVPR